MATRPITPEETAHVDELVARGASALAAFEGATQQEVDRLCQAVAWSVANEKTFERLAQLGVEESGIGDPVSRVVEALQGDGHSARCAAPEERRRDRRPARQGNREVRQAGWPGRIARADDESGADSTWCGPVRDQVSRRGDLLAPSAEQTNDTRDSRDHAPRACPRGRARGPAAMPRTTEHPSCPVPDDARRPGPGDRWAGHGQGGVQLGRACVRRRRRELDDGHRRDRGCGRGGTQHEAQQDLGLRVRLLGRRQPVGRCHGL